MMNLSCLCGNVRIQLEARPDYVNACNCSLCARTGARWSYYHPSAVRIEGKTKGFCRTDKPEPNAEVNFCPTCGSTTHFVLTDLAVSKFGNTMMGVNMWLAEPDELVGLELRYPDGKKWSGSEDFSYVRKPRIIA